MFQSAWAFPVLTLLGLAQDGFAYDLESMTNLAIYALVYCFRPLALFISGCGEYRPAGIGTVGYIPPESLVGLVWASASQDIFSVGVMVAQVAMTEATRAGSLFCHPVSA